MILKAVIVDDEPLARARLKALLENQRDLQLVGEADTVREAVRVVETTRPHVLFLDVQMPEESGFDLLGKLAGKCHPAVIFTTAHNKYALDAFDLNAADYLVKPFDRDRVNHALDRARRLVAGRTTAPLPRDGRRERFVVRTRSEIVFVNVSQVDWISAEGNYVRLHCGAQTYLLRESMQSMEESLDPREFVRVHRSAIVRFERVRKMITTADGAASIVLTTGDAVPLGPSYRRRLEDLIEQKL